MVFWGDVGDSGHEAVPGAAYNPDLDLWRTIAPAPIAADLPDAVGWNGTEALFWVPTSANNPGSGGAAYNPASDTWRRLESPSPGLVPSQIDASGSGESLVWVAEPALPDVDPFDQVIASYSNAGDRWRFVTSAPNVVAPANGLLHVAIQGDMLVAAPSVPDATSNSRRAAEWTSAKGWTLVTLPDASSQGRCRTAVVSIGSTPAIVQCERVSTRDETGNWVPAPDAPEGAIFPLAEGGFVVLDNITGQMWWYS